MTRPKKTKPVVNKTAWIQSKDANVPAQDLVDQAKAEGITITLGQVYTARSEARRKVGKAAGSQAKAPAAKAPAAPSGGFADVMRQVCREVIREELDRYFGGGQR